MCLIRKIIKWLYATTMYIIYDHILYLTQGFADKDVFVCENRYSNRHRCFKKIKVRQINFYAMVIYRLILWLKQKANICAMKAWTCSMFFKTMIAKMCTQSSIGLLSHWLIFVWHEKDAFNNMSSSFVDVLKFSSDYHSKSVKTCFRIVLQCCCYAC